MKHARDCSTADMRNAPSLTGSCRVRQNPAPGQPSLYLRSHGPAVEVKHLYYATQSYVLTVPTRRRTNAPVCQILETYEHRICVSNMWS
jgi:hypothetical protein